MNLINRIIVIVGLLIIMIVSALLFLAAGPVLGSLIYWLQQLDAGLLAMTGPGIFLRWGGGLLLTVAIWLICALLIWLQIRRPRTRTVKVNKVSGGTAELTADSIASRLEYNIDMVRDVVRVKPFISDGRNGVKVRLELETSPEIDVPTKTEEIQQLTREIVENRMGLRLDSVQVVMRHTPYGKKSLFKPRKPEESAIEPVSDQPVVVEPLEREPDSMVEEPGEAERPEISTGSVESPGSDSSQDDWTAVFMSEDDQTELKEDVTKTRNEDEA
jgi:hypothetical protein